jgi:hypothetical protein
MAWSVRPAPLSSKLTKTIHMLASLSVCSVARIALTAPLAAEQGDPLMPNVTAEEIAHVEVLASLEEVERRIQELREGAITTERLKQTLMELASHYLNASRALGPAQHGTEQSA